MYLQRSVSGKPNPRPAPQPSENLLAKPTFLLKNCNAKLLESRGRNLSRPFGNSPNCLPFSRQILLLLFVFSLNVHPLLAPQSSESHALSPWTFNSIPLPDFTVGATLPSIVPADGTTPATSTIIVNPVNDFTGTVTLSDLPLPAD